MHVPPDHPHRGGVLRGGWMHVQMTEIRLGPSQTPPTGGAWRMAVAQDSHGATDD